MLLLNLCRLTFDHMNNKPAKIANSRSTFERALRTFRDHLEKRHRKQRRVAILTSGVMSMFVTAGLSAGVVIKYQIDAKEARAQVVEANSKSNQAKQVMEQKMVAMRDEITELHVTLRGATESVGISGTSDMVSWPVGGPAESEESILEHMDLLRDLIILKQQDAQELNARLTIMQEQITSSYPAPPLDIGFVSSGYGHRIDPFTKTGKFHGGVDFAAPDGSPIRSIGNGRVVYSGKKSGYGNIIEILNQDGYLVSYAHNRMNLVKKGDRVQRGDLIGYVGSTGRATGPHLHLEVRKDDRRMNPIAYLSERSHKG